MNCREFTEQFEVGLDLQNAAKAHLKNCQQCQIFQKEESQLSNMLRTLPKVQAPTNFEFGYKSKLAGARNNHSPSMIWQTLRYILPLSAAAVIFGFVLFNSNLLINNDSPKIAEQNLVKPENPISNQSFANKQIDEKVGIVEANANVGTILDNQEKTEIAQIPESNSIKNQVSKEQKTEIKKVETKKENKKSEKIFSSDVAVEKSNVITPEGLKPNKTIVRSPNNQEATTFSASEILNQLGIETSNENGKLKVNSIRQSSAGENSDVKVGDVVTAIDGQKLSDQTIRTRTVQGKTLTVDRNNQQITIQIKNN